MRDQLSANGQGKGLVRFNWKSMGEKDDFGWLDSMWCTDQ